MTQSGGIFEATSFVRPCEVSRQTIVNYLGVLEATFVAHVIRPFAPSRASEIVAAPRVYGFDTGFVCHYRGWAVPRPEDMGPLWEHFVLNELHSLGGTGDIRYWRSKSGAELDFVLAGRRTMPTAIECKWKAHAFNPTALKAFRARYPGGRNFVVASDVDRPYERRYGAHRVRFLGIDDLRALVAVGRRRIATRA